MDWNQNGVTANPMAFPSYRVASLASSTYLAIVRAPLIHSFNTYLLKASYMPEDRAVNKSDKDSCLQRF